MSALPRLLVVTDRHQAAAPLETIVTQALDAGARWIWLRDRDMAPAERHALAQRLRAITRQHGARLTIGGDVALAATLPADGVHLAAGAAIAAARAQLAPGALIGVSAHGDHDIASAHAAGADYATVSPIFSTASKPGYGPALGLAGLQVMSRSRLPAFALGGVTAQNASACLDAGAAGIAVMGEVMRAAARRGGVREVVTDLLAALGARVE